MRSQDFPAGQPRRRSRPRDTRFSVQREWTRGFATSTALPLAGSATHSDVLGHDRSVMRFAALTPGALSSEPTLAARSAFTTSPLNGRPFMPHPSVCLSRRAAVLLFAEAARAYHGGSTTKSKQSPLTGNSTAGQQREEVQTGDCLDFV